MPATTRNRHRTDSISPALERLVTRFSDVVRQVARQHNLSEADVDEVFQDVRIRLWRALATGEKIAGAPASYVYRTAISAALDLIRRRRARREEGIDRLQDKLPARNARTDHSLETSDFMERLSGAISALKESRRVVVRMYLIGYHREEIAELLGWTEAKTRNLLYRGLSELRTKLSNGHGEPRVTE